MNIDTTVIIPLYKGEKYIPYWLDKLNKNFTGFTSKSNKICEVLLINDYPEVKLEIENKWIYQLNLRIYNLEINKGIHGARVFGINKARGNYVIILDQDDKITDDYIEKQRERIENKDAVLCNGYMEKHCIEGKRKIYADINMQNKAIILDEFISNGNRIVSPGQMLLKKDAIPKLWLNRIMEKNGADDYLLWILMLNEKRQFCINPECLYAHVGHGENASSNINEMRQSVMEVHEILQEQGLLSEIQLEKICMHANQYTGEKHKLLSIINLYDKWMFIKIRNGNLSNYFSKNKICNIAIYGMNYIGNRLYDELENSNVQVICGIDKDANALLHSVPIYTLEDDKLDEYLEKTDAVVVTATTYYESIKCELEKRYNGKIISFSNILAETIENL